MDIIVIIYNYNRLITIYLAWKNKNTGSNYHQYDLINSTLIIYIKDEEKLKNKFSLNWFNLMT